MNESHFTEKPRKCRGTSPHRPGFSHGDASCRAAAKRGQASRLQCRRPARGFVCLPPANDLLVGHIAPSELWWLTGVCGLAATILQVRFGGREFAEEVTRLYVREYIADCWAGENNRDHNACDADNQ
jgi:hypothetical protein